MTLEEAHAILETPDVLRARWIAEMEAHAADLLDIESTLFDMAQDMMERRRAVKRQIIAATAEPVPQKDAAP